MESEQAEIRELMAAVDQFAFDMKNKLTAEAKKGKRGWDEKRPETDLCEQIIQDARDIQYKAHQDKRKQAIDIANRAMMIWYRAYGKAQLVALEEFHSS